MAAARRDDGWADWRGDGESAELQIDEGKDDPKRHSGETGKEREGEGSGDPGAGSEPRGSEVRKAGQHLRLNAHFSLHLGCGRSMTTILCD